MNKEERRKGAERKIREALQILGWEPALDTEKTPARVTKYWDELINYEPLAPMTKFPSEGTKGIVLVKDIGFSSSCAHHHLPFYGKAHVAYLPGDKIYGLSKLARIVKHFGRRFQTQEYMNSAIADFMMKDIDAKGVCVILEASHTCMSCRGVEDVDASTTTSEVRGVFDQDSTARMELMNLIFN